ncbi:hypothetical protein KXD93_21500 [Mucilaginibacter sp. BJC16-A38]|uniref:hypothetical protein n=1 Tax=Mucilaginibacter phenanthrenivorans TaxID=1234842 RepID=UPI002157B575|nr:hypothetical protein [Mucilaginibacter phenanthrenivorans]MCR8560242.1 hypothetical protein [Mucilaginibacter phenanthrenivorans]
MNNRHHWRYNVFQKLIEPQVVVYLAFIRNVLNDLPGVTEKPCYSTPAFYVNKKIFCRLKEDCETLVIQCIERDKWMDTDPVTFFVTDHYLNTDFMLVALETVSPGDLSKLLVAAWYSRAPKKLVDEYKKD